MSLNQQYDMGLSKQAPNLILDLVLLLRKPTREISVRPLNAEDQTSCERLPTFGTMKIITLTSPWATERTNQQLHLAARQDGAVDDVSHPPGLNYGNWLDVFGVTVRIAAG
jgi:hypothetical protein